MHITVSSNVSLVHSSFSSTGDLVLASEFRFLNRHTFGIFSKARCGQSRPGRDLHCNLVLMRARRLTFSSRILQARSDEVWLINSVNQPWLVHVSIRSAVRWHPHGGKWIWLSLFLQGGDLLTALKCEHLSLSHTVDKEIEKKIWIRNWLRAKLKSHLPPHKSACLELCFSSSA